MKHAHTNNRKDKAARGDRRIAVLPFDQQEETGYKHRVESYQLDWFHPEGKQHLIVEAMETKELVLVDSPSGTGKSTTVLWKALMDYKANHFEKIILIKTPTEGGDDQIGYLSGDKNAKLECHMDAMKTIFYQFMSKGKLENDIKNENIILDIPNYLLGKTFDKSLIILEEAQTMSPNTIKLCSERAGQDSVVVIVGDSKQRYSVKKREDGLSDLISRVTYSLGDVLIPKFKNVGYIKMDSSNNMRSSLSRFITEIYD